MFGRYTWRPPNWVFQKSCSPSPASPRSLSFARCFVRYVPHLRSTCNRSLEKGQYCALMYTPPCRKVWVTQPSPTPPCPMVLVAQPYPPNAPSQGDTYGVVHGTYVCAHKVGKPLGDCNARVPNGVDAALCIVGFLARVGMATASAHRKKLGFTEPWHIVPLPLAFPRSRRLYRHHEMNTWYKLATRCAIDT